MHRGGLAIAGAFQQRRPEQRVEVQDVLADEVMQLDRAPGVPGLVEGCCRLPRSLQPVPVAGHVADRSIYPDIEVLVVRAGDAETEVGRVARDVPVTKPGLEPFGELPRDAVLHMAIGMPAPQALGKLAEGKEVVDRIALHRRGARDHRARILQFRGTVGGPAGLTAVAVLVGGAAHRALAADEAVRQEHARLGVIGLLDDALLDQPAALEPPEDLLDLHPVLFGVRGVEVVERNPESGERRLVRLVEAGYQFFRRDARLAGLEHDRRAVGIACAEIADLMAPEPLVARPDIGLHVFDEMPDVDRPVGIGQGARHEDTAGCRHGIGGCGRGNGHAAL